MGWIAIIGLILNLIRNIPEIIAAVKAIMAWIRSLREDDKKRLLFELKDAIESYKVSKNLGPLQKLLEKMENGAHGEGYTTAPKN